MKSENESQPFRTPWELPEGKRVLEVPPQKGMSPAITDLRGKVVLVTGGSGFIGGHLCRRLNDCGARLHIVSRKMQPQESTSIHWWNTDLSDIAAARGVVDSVRPHVIFHLASHVQGARKLGEVIPTFYSNLVSTVHLLTAAAEQGCERIILAGSSEEPENVNSETFARSPYAATKWASNIYGRMFYKLFRLPVVMPRIFMTYGPNQKDLHKLVPFVILRLLRGEAPALTSGQRRADWIYVDDVVECLIRSALIPGIEGCSFDIGSGSLVSVREIVTQLVQIADVAVKPVFGALADRPFEQERAANTSFMLNTLGYWPCSTLKQGLAATVDWYRRHKRGNPEFLAAVPLPCQNGMDRSF